MSTGERRLALQARPCFLYIARNRREAELLCRAEVDGTKMFGQALGYPQCCIAWLIEQDARNSCLKRPPNFPARSATSTEGTCYAELNNLLWMLPFIQSCYYLISHYCCSYQCQASLQQALQLHAMLMRISPTFAAFLQQILARPVLLWDDTHLPEDHWDENKGLIFDGSVAGNSVRFEQYLSLRRKRDFCDLGVDVADELVIEPDRVAALRNKQLVGCWFNDDHGPANLLDFRWNNHHDA